VRDHIQLVIEVTWNPRSRPTPLQRALSTPPRAPGYLVVQFDQDWNKIRRSKSTVSTGRDAGRWFARCTTAL
jgi:hypothetical protein